MFWIIQHALFFFYNFLLDFIFFVVVDAFAKFTIGDAATKSRQEKRIIWFWESVVLAGLCLLIYLCDHVPYLLTGLTVMTFVYTQLDGTINLYYWWMHLKTRWEEWQQHQDSMIRMQEQMTRQRQQQEINEAARLNFARRQPMDFNLQQATTQLHASNTLQTNVALPSPKLHHVGTEQKNTSVWNKLPRMRLSSVFKRAENESFSAPPQPTVQPPQMRQEYSFMPENKVTNMSSFRKLGTDQEDSPAKKPFLSKDNLLRRPLRSSQRISYQPSPGIDSYSLRSRVMSAFGMSSNGDVPSGLRNEGQNLCFMNSIIQCLARTPGLISELATENLKDSDSSLAESAFLASVIELLSECSKHLPSGGVLDPTDFRQAASELHSVLVAPPSQRQMQQDSGEFFLWLMDTMHTVISKNKNGNSGAQSKRKDSKRMEVLKFIYGDLNPAKVEDLKKACQQEIDAAHGLMNDSYAEPVQRLSDLEWMSYKAANNTVIDNTFTGQLVIAYHCLTDNHISVNMQTFNILPVPIVSPREVNGLVNLGDCFEKFCNIEHLVGQDGLECSFCNGGRSRQQSEVNRASANTYPFSSVTPKVNGRHNTVLSTDSAISSVSSPLPSNFMSPIPGNIDAFSDSGFHDNVFKTSTPISEGPQMSNHTARPQRLHDAQRRCLLRQLPDCLVIQLMRFSYNMFTRQTGKVSAPVRIPLKSLDLTQIMFDTITQREDLSEKDVSYMYDLYGVCCHLGAESTNCGHYVSYALHTDDKWYKFDDETVTEVNMEYELTRSEVRRNAYILFYKKSTKKSK